MPELVTTPQPPYYAVIFTSLREVADEAGYSAMARQMDELARLQPGYLGIESVRGADGLGITVSYWESLEAIQAWQADLAHREAQSRGRSDWYVEYQVRVCCVERAYGFAQVRQPGRSGATESSVGPRSGSRPEVTNRGGAR
jgi:heme-degrading monooxygenase HmoA